MPRRGLRTKLESREGLSNALFVWTADFGFGDLGSQISLAARAGLRAMASSPNHSIR